MSRLRVTKNYLALASLQLAGYGIPLVVIPFLSRALGLTVLGQWLYALAIATFIRSIIDFGLDLTATRAISTSDKSAAVISHLFACVVIVRVAIFVCCVTVLLTVGNALVRVPNVLSLALIACVAVFLDLVFPTWLYQGMERMATISIMRVATKCVSALLVTLFVTHSSSVYLVPIFDVATTLVAAAVGVGIAGRRFGLRPVLPSKRAIKQSIRDAFPVFMNNLAVNFYTTINTMVLGAVAVGATVAQYGIAEKVYFAIRGLITPFAQAVFPRLAAIHESEPRRLPKIWRKMGVVMCGVLTVLAFLLIVAAPLLSQFFVHHGDPVLIGTLRTFAVSFPFAFGGAILSPLLIARQMARVVVRITVIGACIGLVCIAPLATLFGAKGAALTFLIVQIYNMTALMIANLSADGRSPLNGRAPSGSPTCEAEGAGKGLYCNKGSAR